MGRRGIFVASLCIKQGQHSTIIVGGATKRQKLTQFCCDKNIKLINFLTGVVFFSDVQRTYTMCAIFNKSEMSDSKNYCAAGMEVNQYKGALETKQRDKGKTSKNLRSTNKFLISNCRLRTPGTSTNSTCNSNLKNVEFFKFAMKYMCWCVTYTHINFTQDDVNNATDDYYEIKDVPGISKIALQRETNHTDQYWGSLYKNRKH